jgi:hypothetical protein
MALAIAASAIAKTEPAAPDAARILNLDFESGTLNRWKNWKTKRAGISSKAHAGKHAVALGPESANCSQEVPIRNNSRYRLSAWVKTDAGSEQVELSARDFGGLPVAVASALPGCHGCKCSMTDACAMQARPQRRRYAPTAADAWRS